MCSHVCVNVVHLCHGVHLTVRDNFWEFVLAFYFVEAGYLLLILLLHCVFQTSWSGSFWVATMLLPSVSAAGVLEGQMCTLSAAGVLEGTDVHSVSASGVLEGQMCTVAWLSAEVPGIGLWCQASVVSAFPHRHLPSRRACLLMISEVCFRYTFIFYY